MSEEKNIKNVIAAPAMEINANYLKLGRKVTQIESQIIEQQEKGLVRNPILETAYQDIENLRDSLQQGTENLFSVGVYITLYASTLENLNKLEAQVNNILESKLIYAKPATFQQLEGYNSSLPMATDKLEIDTPLNSGPASSLFPFISADLTSDDGILYGINRHN